jgi:hypothetical protein
MFTDKNVEVQIGIDGDDSIDEPEFSEEQSFVGKKMETTGMFLEENQVQSVLSYINRYTQEELDR